MGRSGVVVDVVGGNVVEVVDDVDVELVDEVDVEVVDEVDELELLVTLVEEVEPKLVPSSVGYGYGHDERPFVASVMYFRQIVEGNEPPVTEMPCTDFMNVPSGYPTQTAVVSLQVKPTNQASR